MNNSGSRCCSAASRCRSYNEPGVHVLTSSFDTANNVSASIDSGVGCTVRRCWGFETRSASVGSPDFAPRRRLLQEDAHWPDDKRQVLLPKPRRTLERIRCDTRWLLREYDAPTFPHITRICLRYIPLMLEHALVDAHRDHIADQCPVRSRLQSFPVPRAAVEPSAPVKQLQQPELATARREVAIRMRRRDVRVWTPILQRVKLLHDVEGQSDTQLPIRDRLNERTDREAGLARGVVRALHSRKVRWRSVCTGLRTATRTPAQGV